MRTQFNSSVHVALALAAAVAVARITASGLTARATTVGTVNLALWTGDGTATNWSDAANWSTGTYNFTYGSDTYAGNYVGVPATGDTVDFGTSTSLVSNNDLSGLSIAELDFGYPASGPDSFTVGGNALTITSNGLGTGYGVYSGAGTGITETINNDLTLNGNSNFRETSSGTLVLTGTLTDTLTGTGYGNLGLNAGSGAIVLNNTSGNASNFTGSLAGVEGNVDLEAGTYTFHGSAYQISGTVSQTGGRLTLGGAQFDTGVYNLGGTAAAAPTLTVSGSITGMGTMNVTANGTLTGGSTSISGSGTSNGVLSLEGGTATLGTITVNDYSGTATTPTAIINLDSGTLTTQGLLFNTPTSTTPPYGTATINSNGGTLEFSAGDTIASSTAATWNVQAGGAVINTDGNAVTIDQSLVSDASADGGLTKDGLGTLNLASTANTYNGNTTVNGGTLEINSNFLASTSTVSIAAHAVMDLNYSGTDIVKSLVLDGIIQAGGIYGVGKLGSTYFTGTGTLTVENSNIPEPATLALMAVAGIGLLTLNRRKKP